MLGEQSAHKRIDRRPWAPAAAILLALVFSTWTGTALHGPADGDSWDPGCDDLVERRPCTEWVARWGSGPDERDTAAASLLSPDEEVLVVAGESTSGAGTTAATLVAFDTEDGTVRWTYGHEQAGLDWTASALAADPAGQRFYALFNPSETGTHGGVVVAMDYAGSPVWSHALELGASGEDLTPDPDAQTLYVVGGVQQGSSTTSDAFVLALDAESGDERWSQVWPDGTATSYDIFGSVVTDGERVYAAGVGGLDLAAGEMDFLVAAFDAEDGAYEWDHRPESQGTFIVSLAADLALVGDRLYVTGFRLDDSIPQFLIHVHTVALDTATGGTEWLQRWHMQRDGGFLVGVSPDGETVYVAGRTEDFWLTVAYDSSSGAKKWEDLHHAGGNMDPRMILAHPDDGTVLVTGEAFHEGVVRYAHARGIDAVTIAYDQESGQRRWIRSYDGPGHNYDVHVGAHFVDGGSRLVAAGYGWNDTSIDAIVEGLTQDSPLTYEPRASVHNNLHMVSYRLESGDGLILPELPGVPAQAPASDASQGFGSTGWWSDTPIDAVLAELS